MNAAYGNSYAFEGRGVPAAEPTAATPETLYDLASLTKLYTATCVMHLVERGRLALDEPVARWLPIFAAQRKDEITVRQLLTHTSGIPALIQLWKIESTAEARMRRVLQIAPADPPGAVFRYSDLGYIVLGRLVEEVAGMALAEAVRAWITEPLGLKSLQFAPPAELKDRIAATEDQSDPNRGLVQGEVHDPSAWSLGGVAGHAGLFGTARDVAAFGQAFLDGGGALLRKETVDEMVRSQIGKLGSRGLGWELNESFYMGRLASPTTFGHTGFTGTYLIVDPRYDLVVALLTNRVHPAVDGPSVNPTRQAVADAAFAVASTAAPPSQREEPVLPGIDVLMRERKDTLRGRRIGLVTNTTGRDRQGRSTIDVLFGEPSWKLVALFSPEHGIRGDVAAGESVDAAVDSHTGLPIHSLYGETTRPTAAMLRGLDVLVYDIQDVGARVYTYTSTLLEALRGAAAHGIPVVVLDRPDPIGGEAVEGTVLDPRFTSFVGAAPIAMRYGMTIGELGRYFNAELHVDAELNVVPLQGWQRSMWLDDTALRWVNPSPNLRSLSAAAVYPGTVLFEGTTLSEGRGTDRPFEWIGAPGLDAAEWAARLTAAGVPGVRFSAAARTPDTSKHAGRECQGVLLEITDRARVQPMALGVTMLALCPVPVDFNATMFDRLAGTDRVRLALLAGTAPSEIAASWEPELERFREIRSRYLLY
jgi:uncharacterized protein YbbC (DUF1343 family)/CubicO group peptidase (beta-lactamase class C family)